MTAENMILIERKPTHPGELLREEFFPEFGLSVSQAASKLHVSRQTINEIVRERRSVTADMAVRLARLFSTTPQYWLNMQRNIDLWETLNRDHGELEKIEPLAAMG